MDKRTAEEVAKEYNDNAEQLYRPEDLSLTQTREMEYREDLQLAVLRYEMEQLENGQQESESGLQ